MIHPEDFKEIFGTQGDRKLEFRLINKSKEIKWVSGERLYQLDQEKKT